MKSIRVALFDPHSTVAGQVGDILLECQDIELTGHYRSIHELTQPGSNQPPDIVVLHGTTVDADLVNVSQTIFVLWPGTRMLVTSSTQETARIRALIANGVVGYISPDELLESLLSILRSIHAGKSVFSAEVMQSLLQ